MTFGWCWPQSVRPGESVTLHVEGERPAEVAVVRDGLTPRVAWRGPGAAATITTGEDWAPCLYLVLLDDAANGIELGYATNQDLEQHPEVLDGCRLLLSVGHDEYWTWGTRDTVDAFVAGGGNVAFLSGKWCDWQVRIKGDVMVGYKHRSLEDPIQSARTTIMWSDESPRAAGTPRVSRSATDCHRRFAKRVPAEPLSRCRSTSVPLWATGRGDQLGAEVGVVGYECDGCELTIVDGLPTGPEGFDVVATAPATPFDEHTTPLPLAPGGRYELDFHAGRIGRDPEALRHGHAVLGCWPGRDGAGTVVTVGCTDWAYGLDDPAVGLVTRTIIERLSG